MNKPSILAQLDTALNELDMAHITLEHTLANARHSALHATYTASLKRILAFNSTTMRSVKNLLTVLKRRLPIHKV